MLASKLRALHPHALADASDPAEAHVAEVSHKPPSFKSKPLSLSFARSLSVKQNIDPRLVSDDNIKLVYRGQKYDTSDDDGDNVTVAKMRRVELLGDDQATIKNGRDRIIAKVYTNPKTNTTYILRNIPSFDGQKPVAPMDLKTMFNRPMIKLYKFAKIEGVATDRAEYSVVSTGQNRKDHLLYKRIYVAEMSASKIIIHSAKTDVAEITFDRFGLIVTFQIKKGVDIAAILAMEQAIYANDSFRVMNWTSLYNGTAQNNKAARQA